MNYPKIIKYLDEITLLNALKSQTRLSIHALARIREIQFQHVDQGRGVDLNATVRTYICSGEVIKLYKFCLHHQQLSFGKWMTHTLIQQNL